jgi:hypothetical protein
MKALSVSLAFSTDLLMDFADPSILQSSKSSFGYGLKT